MKIENIRKSKAAIKTLKKNNFRTPYQIIADNSFIKAVNKRAFKPSTFIEYFKSEPKYFMTKCTYELHKPHLTDRDFSGSCEIIKCGHEKAEVNCVYEFIKENNPHHYILATNNINYINKLKESKHIPVLKLALSSLKIETNKLETEFKQYLGEAASKKELKKLKKLLEEKQ